MHRAQIARRVSNYTANKFRTLEWMKNDDSALNAEFKRGNFVIFANDKPLVQRLESSLTLKRLSYEALKRVTSKHDVTLSVDSSALLDTVPMQSHTNDIEEEWTPVFAFQIDTPKDVPAYEDKLAADLGGHFLDIRQAIFLLHDQNATQLLAKAKALFAWSRMFQHCPSCKSALVLKISRHSSTCQSCKQNFYPPVWPVVIVLVTDHEKKHCLLVRQPTHPNGLYTLVAGFSECGESLEQTVIREVTEEVGLTVDRLEYAGVSQSWPFPQCSLMCAFKASVEFHKYIDFDQSELQDARWFDREGVAKAFQNSVNFTTLQKDHVYIPPAGTLAHELIKQWLLDGE